MWIISLLIGLLLGGLVSWYFCRYLPNEEIRKQNQEIEKTETQIKENIANLEIEYRNKKNTVQQDIDSLLAMKNSIETANKERMAEAKRLADEFLQSRMELAQEQFDRALEAAAANYQRAEEECKSEYNLVIQEYKDQFTLTVGQCLEEQSKLEIERQQILNDINQYRQTLDILVEVSKREEEKKQAVNFYRLVLPQSDIEEIAHLRAVEPFLRDKEALNKVIWKVYYEKPYTDLIGRIVGNSIKTGIYKITNIENQMCYIGQAVDIANRWKTHIKRGIGAEAPGRNKLYPAMLSFGVENFTFEIIEECDRADLDAKEQYWQQVFHAKDFGYSIH